MKRLTLTVKNSGIFLVFPLLVLLPSCQDFLDVDVPGSKITGSQVFMDDASATSAMVGIYLELYTPGSFAGGGTAGIVSLAGLSADELINNLRQDLPAIEFENNRITPSNSYILSTWSSLYRAISQANSVIDRLASASGVSPSKKDQLKGEALFIRAFCNFYLVNLFGDVPLVMTSDYNTVATLSKSTPRIVYDQIVADLTAAETLLTEDYPDNSRTRPNRYTVQSLQARVYLYTGDWARAEDKATNVIAASARYKLEDLNNVFLANSSESIWQLKPYDGATATYEGVTFGTTSGPRNNVLSDSLVADFEKGDQRFKTWTVRAGSSDLDTVYLPLKYRKQDYVTPTNEYSVVFRLAELLLIRAEARARQNKLSGSIIDLNSIRARANLPLVEVGSPNIDQLLVMALIMHEKRIEYLVEWGHRWLDLKRWGTVESVLAPSKPYWSPSDVLYPIPASELIKNANLLPQNSGY